MDSYQTRIRLKEVVLVGETDMMNEGADREGNTNKRRG